MSLEGRSLLEHLHRTDASLGSAKFRAETKGQPPHFEWSVTCEIEHNGNIIKNVSLHTRKKIAILESAQKCALVYYSEVIETKTLDNLPDMLNESILRYYCKKSNTMAYPQFTFKSCGPDHTPSWSVECSVADSSGQKFHKRATHSTKKRARDQAAYFLLKSLQQDEESVTSTLCQKGDACVTATALARPFGVHRNEPHLGTTPPSRYEGNFVATSTLAPAMLVPTFPEPIDPIHTFPTPTPPTPMSPTHTSPTSRAPTFAALSPTDLLSPQNMVPTLTPTRTPPNGSQWYDTDQQVHGSVVPETYLGPTYETEVKSPYPLAPKPSTSTSDIPTSNRLLPHADIKKSHNSNTARVTPQTALRIAQITNKAPQTTSRTLPTAYTTPQTIHATPQTIHPTAHSTPQISATPNLQTRTIPQTSDVTLPTTGTIPQVPSTTAQSDTNPKKKTCKSRRRNRGRRKRRAQLGKKIEEMEEKLDRQQKLLEVQLSNQNSRGTAIVEELSRETKSLEKQEKLLKKDLGAALKLLEDTQKKLKEKDEETKKQQIKFIWEWKNEFGAWKPYKQSIQNIFESSYSNNVTKVNFTENGRKYKADLAALDQTNQHSKCARPMRRRSIPVPVPIVDHSTSLAIPTSIPLVFSKWKIRTHAEVCDYVKKSQANPVHEVSSSFLIQPRLLSYAYQPPEDDTDEVLLFHGTSADACLEISNGEFHPSTSGLLGRGIYFGKSPEKSWSYCSGKHRCMLLCLVNINSAKMRGSLGCVEYCIDKVEKVLPLYILLFK